MYLLLTLIMFFKSLSHLILKIKSFKKYLKRGLEIFQNFHEIFKYLKVKYFIVHHYARVSQSSTVVISTAEFAYNSAVELDVVMATSVSASALSITGIMATSSNFT